MSFWVQYIIIFIIAVIPALIWGYLFLRQNPEDRWLVFLTFLAGMLAAKLILIYQGYWNESFNFIFFKLSFVDFRTNISSLVVNGLVAGGFIFLGVGVMEEFVKFWMMKLVNKRFFRSIDDVIVLSIVAALGFAFFENIIYFMNQWGKLTTMTFTVFVISRVTIVTMVHILCSGILGYYFGMAHFASPVLALDHAQKKRHPVLNLLHNFLHLKTNHIYHHEMMLKGLFLAMILHAFYDFLLFPQLNLHGPVLFAMMMIYFFGGYWYLNHLIKKKNHHLNLGLVGTEILSEKRFAKLVEQVQEIRERQKEEWQRNSRKQSRFKS